MFILKLHNPKTITLEMSIFGCKVSIVVFYSPCFRTFSDKPCESVHTQKTRQLFLKPESDFWMVMVCWFLSLFFTLV